MNYNKFTRKISRLPSPSPCGSSFSLKNLRSTPQLASTSASSTLTLIRLAEVCNFILKSSLKRVVLALRFIQALWPRRAPWRGTLYLYLIERTQIEALGENERKGCLSSCGHGSIVDGLVKVVVCVILHGIQIPNDCLVRLVSKLLEKTDIRWDLLLLSLHVKGHKCHSWPTFHWILL